MVHNTQRLARKEMSIARKETVETTHSAGPCGYTRAMGDGQAHQGLLQRGWRRALDGDRRWGSIDVRPDRFGVTRYQLVVFPPGISEADRRRVRVARGWPVWGALVWVVCEISLSHMTGPWTALVASTATYLGLGLAATMMAGDARRQVRTIGVMVMAGHHDPVSSALHHKLDNLACALLEADELLTRGEISPTAHELTWWRVYNQMDPANAAA